MTTEQFKNVVCTVRGEANAQAKKPRFAVSIFQSRQGENHAFGFASTYAQQFKMH